MSECFQVAILPGISHSLLLRPIIFPLDRQQLSLLLRTIQKIRPPLHHLAALTQVILTTVTTAIIEHMPAAFGLADRHGPIFRSSPAYTTLIRQTKYP